MLLCATIHQVLDSESEDQRHSMQRVKALACTLDNVIDECVVSVCTADGVITLSGSGVKVGSVRFPVHV